MVRKAMVIKSEQNFPKQKNSNKLFPIAKRLQERQRVQKLPALILNTQQILHEPIRVKRDRASLLCLLQQRDARYIWRKTVISMREDPHQEKRVKTAKTEKCNVLQNYWVCQCNLEVKYTCYIQSRYKVNNNGERMHLCRSPLLQLNQSVLLLPIFITHFDLEYMSAIKL